MPWKLLLREGQKKDTLSWFFIQSPVLTVIDYAHEGLHSSRHILVMHTIKEHDTFAITYIWSLLPWHTSHLLLLWQISEPFVMTPWCPFCYDRRLIPFVMTLHGSLCYDRRLIPFVMILLLLWHTSDPFYYDKFLVPFVMRPCGSFCYDTFQICPFVINGSLCYVVMSES